MARIARVIAFGIPHHVTVAPLLEIAGDWRLFLAGARGEGEISKNRKHELVGRPLGNEGFDERLETALERPLKRGKPGPKGKSN